MSHYPRIVIDGIAAATGDGVMIVGDVADAAAQDVQDAILTAQCIIADERNGMLPALSDAWRAGSGQLAALESLTHEQFIGAMRSMEIQRTTTEMARAIAKNERAKFGKDRGRIALAMIEAGHQYRCAICECAGEMTIDHIVPLSKGGTDELDNLRFLCRVCNSRKGNKTEA